MGDRQCVGLYAGAIGRAQCGRASRHGPHPMAARPWEEVARERPAPATTTGRKLVELYGGRLLDDVLGIEEEAGEARLRPAIARWIERGEVDEALYLTDAVYHALVEVLRHLAPGVTRV